MVTDLNTILQDTELKGMFLQVEFSYIKPGRPQEGDTLIGAFEEESGLDIAKEIVVKAYPNPTKEWLHVQHENWERRADRKDDNIRCQWKESVRKKRLET